ncbi:MAG: adenylate/guanylate cyclase domain-containing protein [Chloroflexota bacterium]
MPLWGDTVNTASRMESVGELDTVTLSDSAWRRLEGVATAESRGMVEVRGKGALEIFRFVRFVEPAMSPAAG